MNYKKKQTQQAFLDDIHAVETKHGMRMVIMQAEPQIVIEPLPDPTPKN